MQLPAFLLCLLLIAALTSAGPVYKDFYEIPEEASSFAVHMKRHGTYIICCLEIYDEGRFYGGRNRRFTYAELHK
ncbi:unnamed protein product [Soboliphyme baturini]|uniref:EPM2A protein n=1 Tax=Soboliphyme baturini TaxID=241478 RepID=A0A183IZK3_9BILA|nr:unnamed protein product [Soboliphyme baturini]